jgi:hypothetical protein
MQNFLSVNAGFHQRNKVFRAARSHVDRDIVGWLNDVEGWEEKDFGGGRASRLFTV